MKHQIEEINIKKILKFIRTTFLAGLFVMVPIIATYLALKFLFQTVDGFVGNLPQRFWNRSIPGFGVAVTTAVVLLIGLLASNYLGKKFIELGEKLLQGIPLVNKIYTATKELMQAVTLPNRMVLKEVVLMEYPRKGLFVYAFITSRTEFTSPRGAKQLLHVFIPSVPMPTTGMLIAVPENQVIRINISVEKALKLVVSGGIVSPKKFADIQE